MQPSAQRVIEIFIAMLSMLEGADLAYWVAPNTVLTLSGARAFADGVFWDDAKLGMLPQWQKEIDQSLTVLRSIVPMQWTEAKVQEVRPGESFAGYELITQEGLQYVLDQTSLLHNLTIEEFKNCHKLPEIQNMLLANLRAQQQFTDVSKEDLNHILFGVLVGYPDEAIMRSILPQQDGQEPQVAAKIRHADYYDCPQPVYDYPKSLASNAVIRKHEQLWSSILEEYYQSDFHKMLEKNSEFTSKVRQLGMLR